MKDVRRCYVCGKFIKNGMCRKHGNRDKQGRAIRKAKSKLYVPGNLLFKGE